jgi:ABC-type polysaccharide/polyol phosphate export permease
MTWQRVPCTSAARNARGGNLRRIAGLDLTQAPRHADAPLPSPAAGGGEERRGARRTVELLLTLSESDLRARYGRGRWRVVKWLLDPFALVGVYLLLVVFVLDRPGGAPGLSLACAVVPFQLLMMTVINSMDAVSLRRSIIANMAFPRSFIPVAAALTEAIAFAASLFLLALMMALYGVHPTLSALWLPVVLLVNLGFAMACAYPASLVGLWLPDLRPFAISFVRTLFFVAPGLIALNEIYGHTHDLIKLNPLTGLFEAYRDALLYGQAPAAWELLYPLGIAAVLLAVFLPIYRAEQRHLAKLI